MRGNRVDSPVEAREPDLAIGAHVGRYGILERVGRGAMGVVYGAYDPELDRKIALKLLRGIGAGAAPLARARMMREAKAMARLSHPNVAAVHDVGVAEDDRVFLATEFLSGGTVHAWLGAKPRTWREIVAVFTAAGRGLAAAHAEGLVHRDFKPDNVLLDKDGRARVVDFGLARNIEAAVGESKNGGTFDLNRPISDVGAPPSDSPPPRHDPNLTTGVDMSPSDKLDKLTRTGALMGTPAYMAPEQFLGEHTDERSDQFSFCVALYEALYGERPFEGDTLLSLSVSVTGGHFRPLPKDREVPAWIRRAVMRGLQIQREGRYPSMTALIAALEDDPALKGRRRLVAATISIAMVVLAVVLQQSAQRRRAELERKVAEQIAEGDRQAGSATTGAAHLRELRTRAFAAFDAMDREGGESIWRSAKALVPEILESYRRAERSFDAALVLDGAREGLRARRLEVFAEHLRLAQEIHGDDDVATLTARLAADGGAVGKNVPFEVELRVSPPDAKLTLERHYRDQASRRGLWTPVEAAPTPSRPLALEAGSYRLVGHAAGRADVALPFELRRGDAPKRVIDLALPASASVPEGMVYVPGGESWFGDADEQLRTDFLGTVPIHKRTTAAFLMARDETTYAEWIAFLEELPPAERARLVPNASTTSHGSVSLQPEGQGWQLTLHTAATRYVARSGEPLTYLGRRRMGRQDWTRFPVAGVSGADVEVYLSWLRRTGHVPGARLCDEVEWERAARGADDRLFPNGDELQPDDANFDATYGRVASAYGPDVVGSHPGSRSPFGIDDLAGNVLEFTISSLARDELTIRGGAYYFNSVSARSTNREPMPRTLRDVTTGVRVCATVGETP